MALEIDEHVKLSALFLLIARAILVQKLGNL